MKHIRYILLLFFALHVLHATSQNCKAVRLKFYASDFKTKAWNAGKRNMVWNITYTLKNNGTTIYSSNELCYEKFNTKKKKTYPYTLFQKTNGPFNYTVCTTTGSLSGYTLEVTGRAYYYKKGKYVECTPTSHSNELHNYSTTIDLSSLTISSVTRTEATWSVLNRYYQFNTHLERTDVDYPLLAIPDELRVCRNTYPFVLDVEKYANNINLSYYNNLQTTLVRKNGATWSNPIVIANNINSSKISIPVPTPTPAGTFRNTYAVLTKLNNDCIIRDTFDIVSLDTAKINTIVPSNLIGSICPEGVLTLKFQKDTKGHTDYVWKNQYGLCLSRDNSVIVSDTGKYYLTVTDTNSCYSRKTFTVNYPANSQPIKFATPVIYSCFDPTPSISLTPTNTANFTTSTFKWSTGETGVNNILITQPGDYLVTASSATGNCPSKTTVSVIDTCSYKKERYITHSLVAKIDKTDFLNGTLNTINVTDPRSPAANPTILYPSGDVVNKKVLVRLQYHRNNQTDIAGSYWKIKIPYSITVDGNTESGKALYLVKAESGESVYEAINEHSGGNVISLNIDENNIQAWNKDGTLINFATAIPDDINLEVELATVQIPLLQNTNTIAQNTINNSYDSYNKKIEVFWNPIKQAVEYELQFAFADEFDKNQFSSSVANNKSIFESKGWSIITADNRYTIDATYPTGTLGYRIRPISRQISGVNNNFNHLKYGEWSVITTTNIDNGNPFEKDKIWSKVVTFAEEGKKKEVVTFMDGTLRTKQVLTNLNTEQITLAAETYYDNESRGTVNVLPTPIGDNNLNYKQSLTTVNGGQPLDKNVVDAGYQVPLDNNVGASNYYSQQSNFRYGNNGNNYYNKINMSSIPEADGYVTTQVEYMKDNTGRVKRQSGVGKTFALDTTGENHYTQYFYGTPEQTMLNRLFGSNVGDAVYYSKQMIVDPNGGVSVSYLDNKDRVIATALSGDAPPNLTPIEKPTPIVTVVNLNKNNIKDAKNLVSTSTNVILNDIVNKAYRFTYYPNPLGANNGVGYCNKCTYELEITIKGPKGNAIAIGGTLPSYATFIDDANGNHIGVKALLDADKCTNTAYVYDSIVFTSIFPQLGNYVYYKKLKLIPTTTEPPYQNVLTTLGFPTLEQFINDNVGGYIDSLVCRNDCESTVLVYIRDIRKQDSLHSSIQSDIRYKAIKDSLVIMGWCDPFKEAQNNAGDITERYCENIFQNIVRQIAPNEKYFHDKTFPAIYNATGADRDSLIAWGVITSDNSEQAIKDRWLFEWSSKVARLFKGNIHPEYCHYEQCLADTAYSAFDIRMSLVTGYQEAVAMGYISGAGTWESNNRTYSYGAAINAEIANLSPYLQTRLDHFIPIIDTITNTIHGYISVKDAVKPRFKYTQTITVLGNPYTLNLRLDTIFYRDSMSYDINHNGVLSTAEWDSAYWVRFATTFSQAKKSAIIDKNNANASCPFLTDGDAIVKDPSLTDWRDGRDVVNSTFNQTTFCDACPHIAETQYELLIEKCPALRSVITPQIKQTIIDSLKNYCFRACGPENQLGAITDAAIANGELTGIFAYINGLNPDIADCKIDSLLHIYHEFGYMLDSSGNAQIVYLCDSSTCSIESIIDIANDNHFNYPKVDSLLFREGFDAGTSTQFNADPIYKNPFQANGLIVNRAIIDALVNNPIDVLLPSLNSLQHYYTDYKGDATGYCLLNYTLNSCPSGNTPTVLFDSLVWSSTNAIKIQTGRTYRFSYYGSNMSFNNVDIRPVIKSKNTTYADTLIAQQDTLSCIMSWNRYSYEWTAPIGIDSVYLQLINRQPYGWGNDFMLDEIKFEKITPQQQPVLSCTNFKYNKFFATPYEVTASYKSCDNPNYTDGLQTFFFVDSFGNKITNIDILISRKYLSTSPLSQLPVYNFRNVQFGHLSYTAILTNGQTKKVFVYIASCTLPTTFNNYSGNACSTNADVSILNTYAYTYLNNNTNYACNRSYDTCILKPHTIAINVDTAFNQNDSLGEWLPDTSFQSCIDRQKNAAIGILTQKYNDSLASVLTSIENEQINNCFNSLNETFFYKALVNEYHYTLYYYDQAGNLVQTIPPAGVVPVGPYGFDNKGNWINNPNNEPKHALLTVYKYNSRNQVLQQKTPDAGKTAFFYNKKGQLILSQNAKQFVDTTTTLRKYSFTQYDALGRIVLVGEVRLLKTISDVKTVLEAAINNVNFPLIPSISTTYLLNLTQTVYDAPATNNGIKQDNLRNRVAATYAYDTYAKLLTGSGIATIYSYDEIGNVKTIVQDLSKETELATNYAIADAPSQLRKQVDYDYDLVSGKVNKVVFNKNKPDQFIHRYEYDADNRITDVYTSNDGVVENQDAKYFYFPHGPLARVELANDKIQGVNYEYTLQGWLKHIGGTEQYWENGTNYSSIADGNSYGINQYIPKPLVDYTLYYYKGDKKNLDNQDNSSMFSLAANSYENNLSKYQGLYNGNIAATNSNLKGLLLDSVRYLNPNNAQEITEYKYDQLNRIVASNGKSRWNSFYSNTPSFDLPNSNTTWQQTYNTTYSYDPNGNIKTLKRFAPHDGDHKYILMDSFIYQYAYNTAGGKLINNRLYHVNDARTTTTLTTAANGKFSVDIDNQGNYTNTQTDNTANPWMHIKNTTGSNYQYDEIGEMTADAAESITQIIWTPYGKISEIKFKSAKPNLKFKYDATGNRIAKISFPKTTGGAVIPDSAVTTLYFRDAQGNPLDMATPKKSAAGLYSVSHDYNLYGSSRVGTYTKEQVLTTASTISEGDFVRKQGNREYELSNHLGNVLTTFNDLKKATSDGYVTNVKTVTDYYPFGMQMPNRTIPQINGYRRHLPCDSMIFINGTIFSEVYNNTQGRWTNYFSSLPLTITPTGLQIETLVQNDGDGNVLLINNSFSNVKDSNYVLTLVVDSTDSYFNTDSLNVEFSAIGDFNGQYGEHGNNLAYASLHSGTNVLTFIGSGSTTNRIAINIKNYYYNGITPYINIKLLSISLSGTTALPACKMDTILYRDYAITATPITDWYLDGAHAIGFITKTTTTPKKLKIYAKADTISADFNSDILAMATDSFSTFPGYQYTLTLENVSLTDSNMVFPDYLNFIPAVIIANTPGLNGENFIVFEKLKNGNSTFTFTANSYKTYLNFASTLYSDNATIPARFTITMSKLKVTAPHGEVDSVADFGNGYTDNKASSKYGFDGYMKDKDSPLDYDPGERPYSSKVVRFPTPDKFETKLPFQSPYVFAGNTPIQAVDDEGNLIRFVNCSPKLAEAILTLARTSIGSEILNFYLNSPSENIILNSTFNLLTSDEATPPLGVTIAWDDVEKLINKDNKINIDLEGKNKDLYNSSEFDLYDVSKLKGKISIINYSGPWLNDKDKYFNAETVFHEIYAHVKNHMKGWSPNKDHDEYGSYTNSDKALIGSMSEKIRKQLYQLQYNDTKNAIIQKNNDMFNMMKYGTTNPVNKSKSNSKTGGKDKNDKTDAVDKATIKRINKKQ